MVLLSVGHFQMHVAKIFVEVWHPLGPAAFALFAAAAAAAAALGGVGIEIAAALVVEEFVTRTSIPV